MPFQSASSIRHRYQTKLRALHGWPEMVAAIDLFFLILLFLVVSSSVVRVSGISVELPRLKATNSADMGKFIVTITPPPAPDRDCQFYFQDKPLTAEALRQQLSLLHDRKTQGIIIRADKRVPFEVVAEVMTIAESARLNSFIAVIPPSSNTETHFE